MTASEPCDELRVLVVRMRTDHQNAVVHASGCSRLRQCDDAALLGSEETRRRNNRGRGYDTGADCGARNASPRYRVAARARPPCVG